MMSTPQLKGIMTPAQWREIIKDKVYALYVHEHHRVAIAQVLENQEWLVTLPDNPEAKHSAKDQDDAFRLGRKLSVAWFQGALKQLSVDGASPRSMTTTEATTELRGRTRPFKAVKKN
jgi:hypothetical protein